MMHLLLSGATDALVDPSMGGMVLFYWVLFIVGLGLSFFMSGFETGAYAMNATRFELRQAEGHAGAKTLAIYLGDMSRLISTVLLGNNVANYLLTAAVVGLLANWDAQTRELVSTAILTPIVFLFGEVLPKELFRRQADWLMLRVAQPFHWLSVVLAPGAWVLSGLPKVLSWLGLSSKDGEGIEASTLERFNVELARGTTEGVVSASQATMARRIMSLEKRRVKHAMVPLAEVEMWNVTMPLAEARARMAQSDYSRVPVYRDGPDQLLGVVWLFDVCFGEATTLEACVKPVRRLAKGTAVEEALGVMRDNHESMVFVVDGKQRVLGILTLHDLVTEIVTDLHDL